MGYQLWNGKSWDEISWDEVLTTGAFNGVTSGLFYWGSDLLMQSKVVQQFLNHLNRLPVIQGLTNFQTKLQTELTKFFQNRGAQVSAFLHGGTSHIPTVNQLQSNAVKWWEGYKQTISAKDRGSINKVSVVFDPKSRNYYYGVNKEYLMDGMDDPLIRSLWPDTSLNNFPLGNCAENAALYRALQAGAEFDSLYLCTVNLNKSSYGSVINACSNCTYAFHGAVFDDLSGWSIDWRRSLITAIMSGETEPRRNQE